MARSFEGLSRDALFVRPSMLRYQAVGFSSAKARESLRANFPRERASRTGAEEGPERSFGCSRKRSFVVDSGPPRSRCGRFWCGGKFSTFLACDPRASLGDISGWDFSDLWTFCERLVLSSGEFSLGLFFASDFRLCGSPDGSGCAGNRFLRGTEFRKINCLWCRDFLCEHPYFFPMEGLWF